LLPLEVVEQLKSLTKSEIFPLYEFEPDINKVLDALLPVYIENRIFNVMLQSAAAEHAARQKAMKSSYRQRRQVDPELHPLEQRSTSGRNHPTDFRNRWWCRRTADR
jgi:hypothetical protein